MPTNTTTQGIDEVSPYLVTAATDVIRNGIWLIDRNGIPIWNPNCKLLNHDSNCSALQAAADVMLKAYESRQSLLTKLMEDALNDLSDQCGPEGVFTSNGTRVDCTKLNAIKEAIEAYRKP